MPPSTVYRSLDALCISSFITFDAIHEWGRRKKKRKIRNENLQLFMPARRMGIKCALNVDVWTQRKIHEGKSRRKCLNCASSAQQNNLQLKSNYKLRTCHKEVSQGFHGISFDWVLFLESCLGALYSFPDTLIQPCTQWSMESLWSNGRIKISRSE